MNWILIYYLASGEPIVLPVAGLEQCHAVTERVYSAETQKRKGEEQQMDFGRTASCIDQNGKGTTLGCISRISETATRKITYVHIVCSRLP
jgi:hypothetical protein